MRRFAAVWEDWPQSRAYAISIPASSPLFAAVIPTKRRWRNFCNMASAGHSEAIYPARSGGCIATRLYDFEKRAGVRPLTLGQLFQRGDNRGRSALDVAKEIGHSLPFGIQYHQSWKTFDFIFAG